MTSKGQITTKIVIAVAVVAVLGTLSWFFGAIVWKVVAGIGAGIAGLFGMIFGRRSTPEQQYADAEIKAAKEHEQADEQLAAETKAAEQEASQAGQKLESDARAEAQATEQQIKEATTDEQLDAVVDDEVDKAKSDGKEWDALSKSTLDEGGWTRVVFVAWLLAIAILGMLLVSSLAHAAPNAAVTKAPTASHKNNVTKLTKALQGCRKSGNSLAIAFRKLRKKCKAKLHNCKAKRKIDDKRHITQKAILARPQPVWPYVVGGVLATIAAAAIGAGIGYYAGTQAKPKSPTP